MLLVGREHEGVTQEGAEAALDRLHAAFERNAASGRRPYLLTASIGASRFDPQQPEALESLLESADQAMYARKRLRPLRRA